MTQELSRNWKPRTEIHNQNKSRNLGKFSGTEELGTDQRNGPNGQSSSKPSACRSLALHVQMVLNGVRNHVVSVGSPACRQSIRLRVSGISTPRPEAKSQGECLTHCYLDWDCSPSFLPKNRDLEPTEITEFKLSCHVFVEFS